MYTDENERRGSSLLRDFLLKLILVVIFVLLLVWLLPKFIKPATTPNVDLSPLTSQIFADNLKRMQDAAISYYTTERLPKEVGDKDTMTLRDMIAKKLVIPFVDKNGKACDVDGSYVTITKMDNEYLMKVNLKCSDKEDYVLVHLGCYNYCDTDICAKKTENVVKSATKPAPAVNNPENTPNPNPDNPNKPDKPDNPNNPSPEVCPITSCAVNQTLINPNSKDCYCKNDVIPDEKPNYEYEYKKVTGTTYSAWTPWSNWVRYVDADGIKPYTCQDSDANCLKRVKTKQQREQVGTYPVSYVQSYQVEDPTLAYTQTWCSEFTYEKYGNTVYAKKGGTWVYQGTYTYDNPPADTPTTYYVLVGANYLKCSGTCQTLPKFTFKKYVYTGQTVSVSDNPSIAVSCAKTTTKTVSVYVTRYKVLQREEPAFADIKYYSVQTRTIASKGKTVTKWSVYDDKSLLNDGYKYTGKSRKK